MDPEEPRILTVYDGRSDISEFVERLRVKSDRRRVGHFRRAYNDRFLIPTGFHENSDPVPVARLSYGVRDIGIELVLVQVVDVCARSRIR